MLHMNNSYEFIINIEIFIGINSFTLLIDR